MCKTFLRDGFVCGIWHDFATCVSRCVAVCVQGKANVSVDPELRKRLDNFKTLDDFRLAVSSCRGNSLISFHALYFFLVEQQGLPPPSSSSSSSSSSKSPQSSTATSTSKVLALYLYWYKLSTVLQLLRVGRRRDKITTRTWTFFEENQRLGCGRR